MLFRIEFRPSDTVLTLPCSTVDLDVCEDGELVELREMLRVARYAIKGLRQNGSKRRVRVVSAFDSRRKFGSGGCYVGQFCGR